MKKIVLVGVMLFCSVSMGFGENTAFCINKCKWEEKSKCIDQNCQNKIGVEKNVCSSDCESSNKVCVDKCTQ